MVEPELRSGFTNDFRTSCSRGCVNVVNMCIVLTCVNIVKISHKPS